MQPVVEGGVNTEPSFGSWLDLQLCDISQEFTNALKNSQKKKKNGGGRQLSIALGTISGLLAGDQPFGIPEPGKNFLSLSLH